MAQEFTLNQAIDHVLGDAPTESTGEVSGEDTPELTQEAAPEVAEEPSNTEAEAPSPVKAEAPKKNGGDWRLNEDLFSEEALSTPEGLKAAAEHAMQGKRAAHSMLHKAQRREAKLRDASQRLEAERNQVLQYGEMSRQQVQAFQATVQELHTAKDPKRAWEVLAKLTGHDDPVKLYEDFSLNVAGIKKEDPETTALKRELEQLKAWQQNREYNEHASRLSHGVQTLKQELISHAQQADGYPNTRELAQDNPQVALDALVTIKEEAYQQTGRPIDDATAFAILEENLRAFRGRPAAHAEPGRAGNPVQTKRAPSPMPSDAGRPSGARKRTEAERLAALAQDSDFLKSWGLPA